MLVSAGGSAFGTVVNVGASIDLPDLAYSGARVASWESSTGMLTVTEGNGFDQLSLSGDYANDLFMVGPDSGSGALVTVTNGSEGIPVSAGETFDVTSGETVSGLMIESGGVVVVENGGTALAAHISGGGFELVQDGGVVSGTVVFASGNLVFSSGAVGTGNTYVSAGATMTVLSGGLAEGNIQVSGGEVVVSGGTVFGGNFFRRDPGGRLLRLGLGRGGRAAWPAARSCSASPSNLSRAAVRSTRRFPAAACRSWTAASHWTRSSRPAARRSCTARSAAPPCSPAGPR